MNRTISSAASPPAFSAYSHAVEVPARARTLYVSGQVGITLDGTLAANAEAQHEQAWTNVFAILAAADMSKTDIVDVQAIVSDHAGVPVFRQVRDRMLDGHMACSTLLVCGLASPDWKVEIAVTAAKVD
jgi:enamine deaminase RidA (YjgF/YER057c/UK114 family)